MIAELKQSVSVFMQNFSVIFELLHKVDPSVFLHVGQMYERVKCNSSFVRSTLRVRIHSTSPLSTIFISLSLSLSLTLSLTRCNDLSYPGNACRRLTLV